MKRISNLVVITVLSAVLSGCTFKLPGNTIAEASVFHDHTKKSGKVIVHTPELNTINTREVGENLYEKINKIFHNTFNVRLMNSVNGTVESIYIANAFVNESVGAKSIVYNNKLMEWNGKKAKCGTIIAPSAFYKDENGRNITICIIDELNNGVFTASAYDIRDKTFPLTQTTKYTLKHKSPTFDKDSFKYLVLYQGKIDNKIKISFMEFVDDMARPAFTQDIEYELNKEGNTIIGFKGLRIEVLKATNMNITYKVIKDYS